MIDYWQPEFYSFSQDSIEFAKFVLNQIQNRSIKSILDLGCGCGVVGIEILKYKQDLTDLYSLDSESSFRDYYLKNADAFIPHQQFQFIHESFKDFKTNQTFDCIVSNPPYFTSQAGRPNPDPRTNHARRWSMEDQHYFLKIFLRLAPLGEGYFLSRMELEEWQQLIDSKKLNLKIKEVHKVAGAKIFSVISFE